MQKKVKTLNFFDLLITLTFGFIVIILFYLFVSYKHMYIIDNFLLPLFLFFSFFIMGIYSGININKTKNNEIAGLIGFIVFKKHKEKFNENKSKKETKK